MERAVPILPGDDVTTAKKFYVNELGFNVAWEWRSDDGRSGLVGLERNGIELTIDCPMTGHGREACVSLRVDNADAYYEEWKNRVPVKRAPKNESWGSRTFGLIDPFGNTLFVIGPLADETSPSSTRTGS